MRYRAKFSTTNVPQAFPQRTYKTQVIVHCQILWQSKSTTNLFKSQFSQVLGLCMFVCCRCCHDCVGCTVHPCHDPLVAILGSWHCSNQVHDPACEWLCRDSGISVCTQTGQAVSCNSNWWWSVIANLEVVGRNRYFRFRFTTVTGPLHVYYKSRSYPIKKIPSILLSVFYHHVSVLFSSSLLPFYFFV